jgi:hypothetical protein
MLGLERNSLRPTHRHARRRLAGARFDRLDRYPSRLRGCGSLRGLCSISRLQSQLQKFYRVPDCDGT